MNTKKILNIPSLNVNSKIISNFEKKVKLFNSHFASQCNPVNNSSVPPLLEYKTNEPLVSVNIKDDIYPILGNSILKKLMNGMTDQLGGFHVAEKLLWNLYSFMSFLEAGVYPDYWKKSNVVPIHKKESKNLIKNYRTISLLSCLQQSA